MSRWSSSPYAAVYAMISAIHLGVGILLLVLPARGGLRYFWAWQFLMAVAFGARAIRGLAPKGKKSDPSIFEPLKPLN